ncbi:MAG: multicopper oxidase domain-containing protein [Catenulispora sp.]|nr:multicopper oxidase domain-containing protein [Catenulispora sp.]
MADDRSTRTLLRRPLPVSQAPGVSPRRRLHGSAATLISGYLLAAAVVVAAHGFVTMPQWLALHLLVLGAATNAVFVYSRHFAQALLHVKPAPERPAYIRLALLNVGVVAVLCGMAEGVTWLAVTGAAVVVGTVVAHVGSLVAMARAATLSGRLRIVVWFYVAGGIALAVGGSLGGLLASGTVSSERWEQAVRLAHAHLNVLGWLGLVIVGTQFMLWPAVLRTKIAEDSPAVARRVLRVTTGGLGVAVAGLLLTAVSSAGHWLAVLGMLGYTAGVACSWVPAVREARVKPPRSAAAVTLLLGNAWLIAALLVDVTGLVRGAAEADDLLGRLLVPALGIGSVAQILIGALMFLLPVTLGGGPVGNRRMTSVLGYAWIPRTVLGNVGILMLMLPMPADARPVAWAMVLAEFASFPALVAASVVAARRAATDLLPLGGDVPDRTQPERRAGLRALAISSVVVVLTALGAVGISVYGGTGPGGPAVAAASGVPVAVTLDEFAIKPSGITVAPGADLVLAVRNTGRMHHDLRLDGARGTRMLAPGEEQVIDLGVVQHSEQAWCTVSGHKEAGMTLAITVAAPGTASPSSPSAQSAQSAQSSGGDQNSAMPGMAQMPGMTGDASPAPQWRPYDATLRPVPDGTEHEVTLHVQQTVAEVAPGVRQQVWTYNGTVPGPTLHGRVGDLFTVHLVNDTPMPHSVDFHASQVDPAEAMQPVPPGGQLTYQFRAEHAGIWLYHCGTPPMIQHVAMGMYGAVVIDPPGLAPVAASEVFVQSEFYLGKDGGIPTTAQLLAANPDLVTFNGYANQYRYAPLHVRAGQRVRLWVLDAGPNEPDVFHIVGAQFDTVFKEGAYLLQPGNAADGAAAGLDLQPGQGGFVELTFPKPGTYTFITHRLADGERGAAGTIIADS